MNFINNNYSNKEIRRYKIIILTISNIMVFCVFISSIICGLAIYHDDSTLAGENVRVVLRFLLAIFSVITILLSLMRSKTMSFFIFIPFIYVFLVFLHNYSGEHFHLLLLLTLSSFFLLNDKEKMNVFKLYRAYIIAMAFAGIVIYVSTIFKFGIPYNIVPYYSGKIIVYVDYKISYLININNMIRLCGLFNEPGYFGTIIALILCADNLNLRKRSNIILLMAGLLTFSVAFIFIIFIYFALSNIRRPKLLIPLILVIIFWLFILPNISFSDANIQSFVNRFMLVNGKLSGDNRSNIAVDGMLSSLFNSGGLELFFGYGTGYTYAESYINNFSTFKTYIIEYGIIGFILIFGLPFVAAIIKSGKKSIIVFYIICFFASTYQRPNIYLLNYFVLLFGAIQYIKYNQNEICDGSYQKSEDLYETQNN